MQTHDAADIELIDRLSALRRALWHRAHERPEVARDDVVIGRTINHLHTVHYLLCALQLHPRRKLHGPGGAIDRLEYGLSRTNVYKFVRKIGLPNMDALRECHTIQDVIARSSVLQADIQKVERSRRKYLPKGKAISWQ